MGFYPGGWAGGHGAGQQRYLVTNSTQAAFSLSAAVLRVAVSQDSGGTGRIITGSTHHRFIDMGMERGLRATPHGKGANNATFDYKLWLAKYELNSAGVPAFAQLRLGASGTATLSTALVRPTGSALYNASEIRADGLSATAGDPFTQITNANGGVLAVKVHSPADDIGDAFLVIPDVFDHDAVLFEMDLTGATEANWVYEKTR